MFKYNINSVFIRSPWYNRYGWLGVKKQLAIHSLQLINQTEY